MLTLSAKVQTFQVGFVVFWQETKKDPKWELQMIACG